MSPFHQARLVPPNTKKTVLDAWNGYHSVPLHEDDLHYTTFITPWGRYRYRVAPQGYIASGDSYTRRYDEIVAEFPQKTKCVDDALLWEFTTEKSVWQAIDYIDICGRKGITFNIPKFVLAADTADFAGFEVTPEQVRPCRQYLQAILEFPTPKNITDVRSWFGMLNQVSYAFSMATKMQPFRELLKPGTPFVWDEHLNSLFQESKHVIVQEIEEGVRIFDKSKPTCLATDWSKGGIGFWLFQKHCKCPSIELLCCPSGWKITLVGSRFTSGAESRYAPIEGEALAVADALDKARFFVLGCKDLILAVDHKPLLKILGDRSLDEISNGRLRNLKERTLRYHFRVIHVPGVKHKAADAVSRYPTGCSEPPGTPLPDDIASVLTEAEIQHSFLSGIRVNEASVNTTVEDTLRYSAMNALHSLRVVTWGRLRSATASDDDYNLLLSIIESGMPEESCHLPPRLRGYHPFRDHLYSVDGVILYKERVLVPPALRQEILASLHAAHQGVTAMNARAESSVFWPGITADISSFRKGCNQCNRMAPSQPSAPPTPLILPVYPFQCLCADFFTYAGVHYLIMVDRYSNWPVIERTTGGSQGLIASLRRTFVTYGIPEELASDGGPEFTAGATGKFLEAWGVHHRLSSVAFPHSNCRAEIGVKSMKRLLADNTGPNGELDTDKVQRAVLQYRNSPDPTTKVSPAMCLFGRPIRDFIPVFPGRYEPHSTWKETLQAREEALRVRHMRSAERLSEHTKLLPQLRVGDQIRIQNQTGHHPLKWDKTGRVIEVRQYDQYAVRVDGSGRVTLRNRRFLRKYDPYTVPPMHRRIQEDLKLLPQVPTAPAQAQGDNSRPLDLPGQAPQTPAPYKDASPAMAPETLRVTGGNTTPLPVPTPQTLELEQALPTQPTPVASPPVPHDGPVSDTMTSPKQSVSRAVQRLLSHNSPGLSEQPHLYARPYADAPTEPVLRRSPRSQETV